MADRLTQLQDYVNEMANHMCNSIGILQQSAPTFAFDGSGQTEIEQEEMCNLFGQLIARTVKDIDLLIESLPTDDSSLHSQAVSMQQLEAASQEAATKLDTSVKEGQELLNQIQFVLHQIADIQLQSGRLKELGTSIHTDNDNNDNIDKQ